MDTYIEKIYIECLKELGTDDADMIVDATDLRNIEDIAKDRLKVLCNTDHQLASAIKSDYIHNQELNVYIFHILYDLYAIYDRMMGSSSILDKFIQCLKNYQRYNSIVTRREPPFLSYIIKGLEKRESKEAILEYFDKFLSSGTEEDHKFISALCTIRYA